MKTKMKTKIGLAFAKAAVFAVAAALLPSLCLASVWAAPQTTVVQVPAGAQSFSIDLAVDVAGEPFAGIEVIMAISDESALEFASFRKGGAYANTVDLFEKEAGLHEFGFFSDSNEFAGGRVTVGTLDFSGYTGDSEVTLTMREINVYRMNENKRAKAESLYNEIAYTVRRGSGGSQPSPTPDPGGPGGGGTEGGEPGTGSTGSGGDGTSVTTPAPTPSGGAAGEPTRINDQETPTGIRFLKEHMQFITGYPDGTVGPDASITRAEAVTIFYRLIDDGAKETPIASTFNDIPADEWYVQQVAYAAQKGIVIGYEDGGFHPEDQITRAEFATIMARFVPAATAADRDFPDVPGDHWALGYIRTCVANGWIIGYEDGTFAPESPISRAEAVTILNRALGRAIAPEDIPAGAPSYSDLPADHWAYAQIIEASVAHTFTLNANGTEIWD